MAVPIRPKERCCIPNGSQVYKVIKICDVNMKFHTRLHYNCKCCTPTVVSILGLSDVQDIWIYVNVVEDGKRLVLSMDILNTDE